ncbi:MAG: hypothetical protein OJF60_000758 [Burkholderiaceae bacterium]|nr:MAG: hypothetical protein OJF60_000758 [Burkholderiaceae bacterium]
MRRPWRRTGRAAETAAANDRGSGPGRHIDARMPGMAEPVLRRRMRLLRYVLQET